MDAPTVVNREDEDVPSVPAQHDWYGSGSWATDPRYTIQEKLVRWQFWVVMRQRNISWLELREELGGVSGARLGQMLRAMTYSTLIAVRLEAAVQAITERKHSAVCSCDDLNGCAVYTAIYGSEDRLIQAKKGEYNEWRSRNAETLSGSIRTASQGPSSPETQKPERRTQNGGNST